MVITGQVAALEIPNHRKTPVFVHGSSNRQCFDFPKFIMDYILKNPKSWKLWKKFIQTCKWFFDKNPIVVISCLHLDNFNNINGFSTCSTQQCNNVHDRPIKLINAPFKLWITELLKIVDHDDATAKSLIPHKNEKLVSFEKILESLPQIQAIDYIFMNDGRDVTPNTVKKIAEMEHVKKCYRMNLTNIPPNFDFDAFSKFMLDNKQVCYVLVFYDDTITEEYMVKIRAFAEKLKTENYGNHCRPAIFLNDIDLVNDNNGDEDDIVNP
uniref:Uncharacterized protein n=1 Tax=Panagrolaimus davidi TaxID=227884 RepID=A0A914Q4Q2_9BILA